jgi:hypothetical protein
MEGDNLMNVYILYLEGGVSIYVRTSFSFEAVNWAERQGVHVSAYDVATRMPAMASIFTLSDKIPMHAL